MGDILKMSPIVNPMSKTVMTVTVNDQMQINLDSKLPPGETIKILQSIITDVLMNYTNAVIENFKKEQEKLKLT